MAGERTVKVKFAGDAKGVNAAAGDASRALSRFGQNAQQAQQTAGKAGQAAAVPRKSIVSWDNLARAAAGAWAAMQVGRQVWEAVEAAAGLAAAASTVEQVFGSAAATVQAFGAAAADTLGQSNQAVLQAAANFGTFGKAAGLVGEDLANFSTELITLASDLAAFRDTSPEQAIQAIGAALRGEAEPIRAYGVLLDDATLRQKAFELGLIATTKTALTPANRVLAAHKLILDQTTDAQGQFAREADSLGGQQARLNARWEDAQAALGEALLPAAVKVIEALSMMAGFVKENHGWLVPTVGVLVALVAGILAVAAAIRVWASVQVVLNAVLAANPIGLIILAVAALVAGITLIVVAIKRMGIDWGAVWESVKELAGGAVDWIRDRFNGLVDWVGGLPERITARARGMWDGLSAAFKAAINWIIRQWNGLEFRVPSFTAFGVTVGGFTLGVPDIPEIRDMGGPVQAGRPYWIGLNRRPELFVPNQSGTVLTQDQAAAAGATEVRVFIGDRELTDIIRVERVNAAGQTRRWVRQAYGGAAA